MYKITPLFLSLSTRTICSNFDQGTSTSKFILDDIMLRYSNSLYQKICNQQNYFTKKITN